MLQLNDPDNNTLFDNVIRIDAFGCGFENLGVTNPVTPVNSDLNMYFDPSYKKYTSKYLNPDPADPRLAAALDELKLTFNIRAMETADTPDSFKQHTFEATMPHLESDSRTETGVCYF